MRRTIGSTSIAVAAVLALFACDDSGADPTDTVDSSAPAPTAESSSSQQDQADAGDITPDTGHNDADCSGLGDCDVPSSNSAFYCDGGQCRRGGGGGGGGGGSTCDDDVLDVCEYDCTVEEDPDCEIFAECEPDTYCDEACPDGADPDC